MAELSHPHVVHVYDFVEDGDLLLLVMEHLDRGSLADAHERGEVSPLTACGAVMAACAGVQFVHERGVLHRDLKPENLMLDSQGTLKVTDFGLARADGDVRRTRQGDLLGSPAYMAPEQAAGGEVGAAADVYTLGASLYYLLSGSFPHDVDGRHDGRAPAAAHRAGPAPGAGRARGARLLHEVVMASLAIDPADRPASAEALGVAVGGAAAEAWGPGWIERSSVQVARTGSRAHRLRRSRRRHRGARSGPPRTGTRTGRDRRHARLGAVLPRWSSAAVGRGWPLITAVVAAVVVAVVAVLVVVTRPSGDDSVATSPVPLVRTATWTFATGDEVFATAAASGPNAIVGSVDGSVYAIDARDGREVWRAVTGGAVRSSAAVDGGRAFVGSFDGNLYALDATTGAEVWRAPTGFEIVSSPAVADGLVVVGSGDLQAFDVTHRRAAMDVRHEPARRVVACDRRFDGVRRRQRRQCVRGGPRWRRAVAVPDGRRGALVAGGRRWRGVRGLHRWLVVRVGCRARDAALEHTVGFGGELVAGSCRRTCSRGHERRRWCPSMSPTAVRCGVPTFRPRWTRRRWCMPTR